MRVSWERLGGVLGVLGCVLAILVVLGRQHFRFFLNSGTLKGSSKLFQESQGVPASVPESGRASHGPWAMQASRAGSVRSCRLSPVDGRLVVVHRRSIRRWALRRVSQRTPGR